MCVEENLIESQITCSPVGAGRPDQGQSDSLRCHTLIDNFLSIIIIIFYSYHITFFLARESSQLSLPWQLSFANSCPLHINPLHWNTFYQFVHSIADITSTCLASLSLYSSDFRFCILVQSSVGVLCPAKSHHVMSILAVHNPQKLEFTKASPVLQERGSERCRSYRTALPLLVPRLWERGAEGHKDCASSFCLFRCLHFVQEWSPWLCSV